jgi:hypothetical protein
MTTFNYDHSKMGPAEPAQDQGTFVRDADDQQIDDQSLGEALFGEKQAEQRAAEALKTLPYRSPADGTPYSQDQRESAAASLAQIGADLNFTDAEFRTLLDLAQKPLSIAEQHKQEAEVIREFETRYGKSEAAFRLTLAQQLARKSPAFQRFANASGHGSNKQVIQMLADRAWSARARGEL